MDINVLKNKIKQGLSLQQAFEEMKKKEDEVDKLLKEAILKERRWYKP